MKGRFTIPVSIPVHSCKQELLWQKLSEGTGSRIGKPCVKWAVLCTSMAAAVSFA